MSRKTAIQKQQQDYVEQKLNQMTALRFETGMGGGGRGAAEKQNDIV